MEFATQLSRFHEGMVEKRNQVLSGALGWSSYEGYMKRAMEEMREVEDELVLLCA